MTLDLRIKEWATPTEARMIDAFVEYGSYTLAGDALEIHRSTIQRAIDRVKQRAVINGYVPQHGLKVPLPSPLVLDRATIHSLADGTVIQQWTKAKMDHQKYLESIRDAVASFLEDVEPVEVPYCANDNYDDVIPWLQIGDAHFNMLARLSETGRNFDLDIAFRELKTAFQIQLEEIQPCDRMVINDLGDFTHAENTEGQTQRSRHQLDCAQPFPQMITIYSKLMRWLINECLKKAQHVDVIVNQGNHSRTNDMWMAELIRVAYPTGERVHVVNNDNVFIGYRMGNTFVMIHHSDQCPPKRLAGVLITDFAQDFGETEYHYIDVGHVHHGMVLKEHPSLTIESFNNMAPNDKWHHDSGYRSKAMMTVVFRSKTYGDIGRRVLPVKEVWDRLELMGDAPVHYKKVAYTV